jgi:hypothetical protein
LGALPCGGGRRAWWCGGVFFSSFLFSFLRVEGGGGWVAILLSNPKVSSCKPLRPVCGVLAGLLP